MKDETELLTAYKKTRINICHEASSQGKREAEKRYGKGPENLKPNWAAYHLLRYVDEKIYPGNEKAFEDGLDRLGIHDYKSVFRKLCTRNNGFIKEKFDGVFRLIERIQGVCEMEAFARFLEFCRNVEDSPLPFLVFGSDSSKLDEAIEDIRQCIELQKRRRPTVGLHIDWETDGERPEDTFCKVELCDGGKPLAIPNFSGKKSLREIATLLSWRCRLTPIVGRESEKRQLRDWLNRDDPRPSCKLVYGVGGSGKTRLAFDFAEEIDGSRCPGWRAGQASTDFSGKWVAGDDGILLIVDSPEHRRAKVEKLIAALLDLELPESGPKVRVLFLCREPSYFDDIKRNARELFDGEDIALGGLDSKDERLELLESAWGELNALRRDSEEASVAEKKPLPIDGASFRAWEAKPDVPSTPLMILALAVYVFETDCLKETGKSIANLSIQKIFRYLSKKEADRIEKEVNEYSNTHSMKRGELEFEGVLLIKAVAAIAGELDYDALRALIQYLNGKVDYGLPGVKILRRLSVLTDGLVPAMGPDLLAADFLIYCLSEFAKSDAEEWVLAATGITEVDRGNVDNERVEQNFSRLNRLIGDSERVLYRSWPIEAIKNKVNNNNAFSQFLATCFFRFYPEPQLAQVYISAIREVIKRCDCLQTNAELYNKLAICYRCTGSGQKVVLARRRGVEVLEQAIESYSDPSVYGLMTLHLRLASQLSALVQDLRSTDASRSEVIDVLRREADAQQKVAEFTERHSKLSEVDLSWHLVANCYYQICLLSLSGGADDVEATEAINTAVCIYESHEPTSSSLIEKRLIHLFGLRCGLLRYAMTHDDSALEYVKRVYTLLGDESAGKFALESMESDILRSVDTPRGEHLVGAAREVMTAVSACSSS